MPPPLGSAIYALVSIVPLEAIHDNDTLLVNDIPSVLSEKDIDHLHNTYQISWDTFWIYAPNSNIHVDDHVLAEDTIIVYEEQLKAGLRFSIDHFYTQVLNFHKFSIA